MKVCCYMRVGTKAQLDDIPVKKETAKKIKQTEKKKTKKK